MLARMFIKKFLEARPWAMRTRKWRGCWVGRVPAIQTGNHVNMVWRTKVRMAGKNQAKGCFNGLK